MILLDTNVLSECMRPVPSAPVVAWLDAQAAGQVWVCAISRAEIELGVALLADERRKLALGMAAEAMFAEDFSGRCLSFDEQAASQYAAIVSARTRLGRPVSMEDAQIAAIALAHGMTLATRNERDFEAIDGLSVVNPWRAAP
ncbi:MAG: type II toxin-antitoxin system VapC family toxin [Betaproteobacteria bacterium]|nr:type II toxin-antitoxin system VapC family toxin [Betaproteobacteria bacterium]MDE2188048.1 type II toxin-antitoxin system VapC family toxin [Betaproteobacteria bacterium]